MSKFTENNLWRIIKDLLKSKDKALDLEVLNDEECIYEIEQILLKKPQVLKEIWKSAKDPIRNIVLWGWDKENNPSLLILYGLQEISDVYDEVDDEASAFYDYFEIDRVNNKLEDSVNYSSYVVCSGKDGHLPSFEAFKVVNSNKEIQVYYAKDCINNWYYYNVDREVVKGFKSVDEITLPYFKMQTYEQQVEKIKESNIELKDFKIANHPNEILKLTGELAKYTDVVTDIMSYNNLYIRKKRLKELLEVNPPKEIFKLLLELGSSELISGLFLELAKLKNNILFNEAKEILESEVSWVSKSYGKGIKRCASIYVNSIDEDLKEERTKWIRNSLKDMDFNLIRVGNKKIDSNEIIQGYQYRKYASSGELQEYYIHYDYNERKYNKIEADMRYNITPYNDGTKIKLIDFKNTIQEAEAYGLADVIGKIAYFLDAPRMTYYFSGNSKMKELKYFKRYARRVIDFYAENDEEKFMEAMKTLFSSYKPYDYIGEYRENYQFNEYIRHYLYYDFKEKAPALWEDWRARESWLENDQLLKLEGRYELNKESWDKHLDVVLHIISNSEVNTIIKACYYILKESPNSNEFIEAMTFKEVLDMCLTSYDPIAQMFIEVLKGRLDKIKHFDSEIMLNLIGCNSEYMNSLAMEYFNKTNGVFSVSDTVNLLFLNNIDKWEELFTSNLERLENEEYVEFINTLICNGSKFKKSKITLSEKIMDKLFLSTNKIKEISKENQKKLILSLVHGLSDNDRMPSWLDDLVEQVILLFSYKEIEELLKDSNLEKGSKKISAKNKQIISILECIKNSNIPSDSEMINILECGTSKMISLLFEIINENDDKLNNRFGALLIMFESEVTVLNKKAEEVFERLEEEKKKKLHGIIIDSPVKRAYSFGLKKLDEIYEKVIPEDFIIQLLEHNSNEVKDYISNKINNIFNNLENSEKEIFMYYMKTVLFLPNKIALSKEKVYEVIPEFIRINKDKFIEVEKILLEIGSSNIIKDSERALVTLVKIREEVTVNED